MRWHYIFKFCVTVWLCLASLAGSAHDFSLVDTTGKIHTLNQYRGRWLVVNYWAPWCPPCLEEVPDLIAFYEGKHKAEVMVLGVAVDYDTPEKVRRFVDDMLMSYPIIMGKHSFNQVQVQRPEVLPSTYIYNPKGVLVKVKRGLVTKHYLEALISKQASE